MYQVIARKYRPQTFEDVVNQEHVKQTLSNALTQGRVGHGYIFSGPRGTGKTTMARIVAKALNCEKGPSPEPCLECASCTEIAGGNSLDLVEIDAASNRRIDDIRELRENVRYRPVRDRYKVFIIDEAHQITADAFNALLKTLEEPPEWVVFILCTTEPHQFPATIVSRCQNFPFRTVEPDQVVERLRWICQQEEVSADEEALVTIALAGDGSIRDSLSTLDQAIASFGNKLEGGPVKDLLGIIPAEITDSVTSALRESQPRKMLEVVEELCREGRHLQHFSGELARYFRNLLVMKVSGTDTRLVTAGEEERKRIALWLEYFSQEDLTRYLQLSIDLYRDLQQATQPRFRLEVGLLKLVHAGRLTPIEKVLAEWGEGGVGNKADGPAASGGVSSPGAAPSQAGGGAPEPPENGHGVSEPATHADPPDEPARVASPAPPYRQPGTIRPSASDPTLPEPAEQVAALSGDGSHAGPVGEPVGESRDDYWIFARLAERLGFGEQFTEGRTADEWIEVIYEIHRAGDPHAPLYEDFRREGYVMAPGKALMGEPTQIYLEAFRADPTGKPLRTPSGRIELWSETIAGYGYDDCPPHPAWMEPFERLGGHRSDRWPLHLVSNQPVARLHSQFDHAAPSQATKVAGREPVRIHPETAAARGISDGDVVRLYNDRGACLAGAVLDDAIIPEAVQLSTGAWYDPAPDGTCRAGNPNTLTADVGTSRLAQGPSAHTCLVEVERYLGDPPPVESYRPPEIVPFGARSNCERSCVANACLILFAHGVEPDNSLTWHYGCG